MDWTTPDDIRAEVQKAWDRGRILSARITGVPIFPWTLRTRRPDRRTLSERFDEVRTWIRLLVEGSRERVGHGYDVTWSEFDHRVLGRNRVPEGIVIPTEADALQLIGKRRAADRFDALASATIAAFPVLRNWLARRPLEALEHADAWPRVLAVLRWLSDHPRPGIYLRQIDLPGVDTKFIESRRKLFVELFEQVLPQGALVDHPSFEVRYGFRAKAPIVRFRVLDPRHAIGGLTDLAVPVPQLARKPPGGTRVFVTENEINGLAFPDLPDAIVIFGLGYGLETLSELPWLHDRALHYWGDLDTHGFVMLDRLRASFPHARSLLMDRATLEAHRAFWVDEPSQNRGPVSRLTPDEQTLFEDLLTGRFGDRVRLEQERIGYAQLIAALVSIA